MYKNNEYSRVMNTDGFDKYENANVYLRFSNSSVS